MPDAVLVVLLALSRLVPMAAVAAWLRGVPPWVIVAIAATSWALTAATTTRTHQVREGVRRDAAVSAAKAIARRSPASLRGGAHDEYLLRLWRGIFARGRLATEIHPQIAAMILAMPIGLAIAWALDGPRVPLVAALAGVVSLTARVPLARRHMAMVPELEQRLRRLSRDLAIGIRGLDEIRAHGLTERFADEIARDALGVHDTEGQLAVRERFAQWAPLWIGALALLAGLAPAAYERRVVVQLALVAALAPIGIALARAVVQRGRATSEASALSALLAAPADMPEATSSTGAPAALVPVTFAKVTYVPPPPFERAAPLETAPVLERVSLTWRGERVLAVLGPNGSGKTTVLSLALRLADPSSGVVSVGGVDVRDLASPAFRRRVAYVTQRPLVLEGMDVRHALTLVADEADDATLRDALESVGLLAKLEARGDPFAVPCSTLSTGESQRVALARAIARRPELLVLDEPEAALDAEGRARLRTLLERLAAGGTRIIIAAQHPDVVPRDASVLQLPLPPDSDTVLP